MIKLSDFHPLPEGKDQFPLQFIEQRQAIRLSVKHGIAHIGLVDSQDPLLQEELRYFLRQSIEFHTVAAGVTHTGIGGH